LAQRVLSALVGILILVGAVWWGGPWLTLLVVVAALLGLREIYRLVPPGVGPLPVALGSLWVVAQVLAGLAATAPGGLLLAASGVFLGGAFVGLLWLIAFYRGDRLPATAAYLVGGPLYVGFPLAHALALRQLGDGDALGRSWLLFALLVTFATDTGAFFTGRAVGRHPMAPGISPGKTWEGAAGGFLLALLAALALAQFLELGLALWQTGAIGAAVGVVAQGGDLLESKLKRLSQVKDSGSIIPGHGGILDRLDSLVAAVPTVYYLVVTVFRS
jgi:phosphatidate cytidylyltransferase